MELYVIAMLYMPSPTTVSLASVHNIDNIESPSTKVAKQKIPCLPDFVFKKSLNVALETSKLYQGKKF